MNHGNVVVFPISGSAFGLHADWFHAYSTSLIQPAILLVTMLLIISVAVLALKRFEHADFDKKVWSIPVLMTLILFWPALVISLKDLSDTFNTFLVVDVFKIPWVGFGFPDIAAGTNIMSWPSEGLARLLPNIAYWVIYAFFLVFFFFDAVLGPLVLAKGVLFDEIATFLELVVDYINLLLWQTTLVILVALIMPDIVSGKPFPPRPQDNYYLLSLILGVLIFFVPTLTRKFGSQVGSAFVPLGFRWSGAMLGITAFSRLGALGLSGAGLAVQGGEPFRFAAQKVLKAEEFRTRYSRRKENRDLEQEVRSLEEKLHEDYENEMEAREMMSEPNTSLIELSKKAKREMKED